MGDWREWLGEVEHELRLSNADDPLVDALIEGYRLMAEAVEGIPADGYCPVCAAQPWMDHLQDNGHGEDCPVGAVLDHLRGVGRE